MKLNTRTLEMLDRIDSVVRDTPGPVYDAWEPWHGEGLVGPHWQEQWKLIVSDAESGWEEQITFTQNPVTGAMEPVFPPIPNTCEECKEEEHEPVEDISWGEPFHGCDEDDPLCRGPRCDNWWVTGFDSCDINDEWQALLRGEGDYHWRRLFIATNYEMYEWLLTELTWLEEISQ